jgi:hypothetical protein
MEDLDPFGWGAVRPNPSAAGPTQVRRCGADRVVKEETPIAVMENRARISSGEPPANRTFWGAYPELT